MRRIAFVFLIALAAAGAVAEAASPPPKKIAPWVKIEGVKVGGLNPYIAYRRLRTAYNKPLRFALGQERWARSPTSLGAIPDIDGAIEQALEARAGETVSIGVRVDPKLVRRYVTSLDRRYREEPVNAELTGLVGARPSISSERTGREVRRGWMTLAIVNRLNSTVRRPLPLALRELKPTVTKAEFGYVIVIQRGANTLTLYNGETTVRSFGVATGSAQYPSPAGTWSIVDKQRNPWWRPPDSDWAKDAKPIPPGPGNPLGTRWMGLSAAAVGIHGTPDAASIGYSASHGCIRMHVPEAEWLFEQVSIGTPVVIT
jgi:L,D-transpeptidase catalytic domain/Putative peptidoglycan binding domain